MAIHIALDPGSTWNGKLEYAKELVDICRGIGADSLKFQLFPNDPKYTRVGNIHLPFDQFKAIYDYGHRKGVTIAASVFDQDSYEAYNTLPYTYIKFAYSRKESEWIEAMLNIGRRVVVSSDHMHWRKLPEHKNLIKLYCVPEYPVRYEVAFEGVFPPFDGFSDHTLGFGQAIRAAEYGAVWIEKHITLEYADITCPDRQFALTPREAEAMVRKIKEMWP